MIIEKISFTNVRKIKQFSETFSPTTTIITGKNGAGKTTVLESIYFLLTTKSFRKAYNKSIIRNNQTRLQIKGTLKTTKKEIITITYQDKKKTIKKNNQTLKTTSKLLKETNVVCVSPEEPDIIEIYKKDKIKYFDRIIFKINPHFIKTIKTYNKLLQIRNTLLENNQKTNHWDAQLANAGKEVWDERKIFFKKIIKQQEKTEKKITNENRYALKYRQPQKDQIKEYISNLNKEKNKTKTTFGPHQDNVLILMKGNPIKEYGSQGEKKLFKYILKIAEAEVLYREKETKPILLLDDFFAKLDDENIMKIFTFFHRKFQTIITTTTTTETAVEKRIKTAKKTTIKTIKLDD
jgi:DNA replication and repair protein RecF